MDGLVYYVAENLMNFESLGGVANDKPRIYLRRTELVFGVMQRHNARFLSFVQRKQFPLIAEVFFVGIGELASLDRDRQLCWHLRSAEGWLRLRSVI